MTAGASLRPEPARSPFKLYGLTHAGGNKSTKPWYYTLGSYLIKNVMGSCQRYSIVVGKKKPGRPPRPPGAPKPSDGWSRRKRVKPTTSPLPPPNQKQPWLRAMCDDCLRLDEYCRC